MSASRKVPAPWAIELPMAGVPRERADAAANRVRILDAARRLLAEHGAAGASIEAVAGAAGVGKATVLRRFGDRAGLFNALLEEHLRDFQDAFLSGPPPLGPGAPADERLLAFLDRLLDLQDSQLELILALERHRWQAPVEGYGTLVFHLQHLIEELSPAVDAATVAQLLLSAVNVHVVRDLSRTGDVDLATIKAAVRPLVAGLANPA